MPLPVALASAMVSTRMLMVLLPLPVPPPRKPLAMLGTKRLATPAPGPAPRLSPRMSKEPPPERLAMLPTFRVRDWDASASRVSTEPPDTTLIAPPDPRLMDSVVGATALPMILNSPPCIVMFRTKPDPTAKSVPPRRLLRLVPLLSRVSVPPSSTV